MNTTWGKLAIVGVIAAIALACVIAFSSPVAHLPKYRAEYFVSTGETTSLEALREFGDVPIGDYPVLRLAPDVLRRFSPALANSSGVDPWGQPYMMAVRPNSDQIGIYSGGQDGRSRKSGNDSDDIASWRTDSENYYLPLQRRRAWARGLGILLTLAGTATILLATSFLQRRRNRIGRQGDADAGHALP
jgi:hypothetical protein